MLKATIVYASWTGNTEEIARILHQSFKKLEIEVETFECQQLDATYFLNSDICVVATYTFGSDGDLPEEIEDFYFDLEKLNLAGKVFGVLGSGEESYGNYCKSVDDFVKQFEKTNAIQGADSVKIELKPNLEDRQKIEKFALDLKNSFLQLHKQTH